MKDTDGRRFRSERTHKALIDACVAYMREAHVPEVTEVATRAGVSVRTVFQHFDVIANLHSTGLRVILGNSASHASNDTRETHMAL